MNEFLNSASSHLTGKETFSEVNVDELERLTNEHPYFSVGQVLLARKYKAENHSAFLPQLQKAAVYFNNPYWLHYQLLDAPSEIVILDQRVEEPLADVSVYRETRLETQEVPEQIKEIKTQAIYSTDEIAAASTLAKETLSTRKETDVETPVEEIEIIPDEMHPEKEEILEEIQEKINEPEVDQELQQTETSNELTDAVGLQDEPEVSELDITDNQVKDTYPEKDTVETVVENVLVQPVLIDEALEKSEPALVEPTIGNKVENPAPTFTEPETTTANEPLIPIEPYYTVDYFASQGIKLTLDKNPQDKLGKQLRSFTDWLKQMKKLGPEDALKAPQNVQVDPTVKDSADNSNAQKEIITEAMADVLIKQGKKEQAIEVYNKLSFLNPDKSAYFADQIQKLKGT